MTDRKSHSELNCNHLSESVAENSNGEEYMVCTKKQHTLMTFKSCYMLQWDLLALFWTSSTLTQSILNYECENNNSIHVT